MKIRDAEFAKLKKQWYKKLKDNGFEDIEDINNNLDQYVGSKFSSGQQNGKDLKTVEAMVNEKIEYFEQAEDYLDTLRKKHKLIEYVWKLHCEGNTISMIMTRLKKTKMEAKPTTVAVIIQTIKREMFG